MTAMKERAGGREHQGNVLQLHEWRVDVQKAVGLRKKERMLSHQRSSLK
jgi:hypothetical protein